MFDSAEPDRIIKKLASETAGMGVCAKNLVAGSVGWKCEDCAKDPCSIICQDCFEKGDHEGHRAWLNTNVSGCCDCGDPDIWESTGFCSQHKGIVASTESILMELPPELKDRATETFY